MNNSKNTGYDDIKGMLKTLRSLNETVYAKKSLTEETEEVQQPTDNTQSVDNSAEKKQYDNIEVVNDVDVKLLSTDKEDTQLKQEEKTSISQIVDSFRQQVSQIANLKPGITITETEILLDDETMDMLEKLRKFEPTFITAMEPLIRDRMSA